VFIENHRYPIWFSREVDAHSYLDILGKSGSTVAQPKYKPAFPNLKIPENQIRPW